MAGIALLSVACGAAEDAERVPSASLQAEPNQIEETTLRFVDVTSGANVATSHRSPPGFDKEAGEMRGGAAVGDFNNDGHQDLFVIGGGLNPDSLFVNAGDGTFEDLAEAAGLAEPHVGSGATVGDFDSDGWLDIFVTSHGTPEKGAAPGGHRLYRNNGDLTFTDVAAEAGVQVTSPIEADGFGAAFGDYDLDGDLDLFVAGWMTNSAGNRLFRNNGDATFTDVTTHAGIEDDGIRGFSPCFVDTDGDRHPELLLVADFGTSRYFKNLGDGSFVDYTDEAGVGLEWSGMGTAIGDFNRDGKVDWYATAIFDDEGAARGDGNKLYLNQGDHRFVEVAAASGVDDGGWGWGTAAVDLDLDGKLDLVEVNGWDRPAYENEMAKVWIQQPDMTFVEIAGAAGLHHDLMGLGLAHLDIDADGDQDIAITSGNDEFRLYETRIEGRQPNWLRVVLDTSANPALAPNGFGSVVRVDAAGSSQYAHIVGCSSYLSSSEFVAHFGLGEAEVVDRIQVNWPDGSTTALGPLVANQTVVVRAPGR